MTTQKDPFLRDPRTLYEILGVPNFSDDALIKDRGNTLLYFQSDDIELASGVFERDSIPHSDMQSAWEIESVLGELRFTEPNLHDLNSPAAKLAHVAPKFFPSDYNYYDGLDDYGSLHSLMRARRHAFALLTNPEFKPEYDRSLGADVDSKWRPSTPNPDRGVDLASEDLPRDPNAGEMPEGAAHSHLSHYVIERRAHSVNRVPVASRTITDLSETIARRERKEKLKQILTLLKRMAWLALLLAITWLIARIYSQTIVGPVLVFLSYGIIKSRGFRRQLLPRGRFPVLDDLGLLDVRPTITGLPLYRFVLFVGDVLRLGVGIAVLWIFGAAHIEHHWNELDTSGKFLSFIFVIAIQPLLAVICKRSARRICETQVPWSAVRARRRKRKQLEKAKQTLSSGRIFGRAGEGLSEAIELFGEERVAAGVSGEQTTVYQLAAGLELIGANYWLFNSLSVPSLRSADVDHALVVDEDVYLIDSKNWAPGFYTMIDGVVVGTYFLESGPRRFVSRSIMSEAVQAYEKYLNRPAGVQEYEPPRWHTRSISSYIIAHPSNPDEPFGVENIKGHNPQLVTLSDFFLFGLRDRNSEGPRVIDGYHLLSLMKNSPRSSSRHS